MMHKNENRPGYKKTKVGWIPEGWECKPLAKAGLQVIDGDRGNNYPSQSDFFPMEYCLFLNAGNVTSDGFRFNENQFISKERDALLRKGKLKRGDLVVTTRGTIGNFAHYTEDVPYEHVRINSGMAIIRNASDKISPSFIWKYFHSSIFDKELRRVTFGSAIPQLTISLIQKFPIPVSPFLTEQEAIAGVLECWDGGIRNLELKIEKKKRIKKGLMQKLLAGKIRLPGFSSDWKRVTLGDVLKYEQPTKYLVEDTNYDDSYGTPVLTAGKTFLLGYTNEKTGIYDKKLPVIIFDDFTTATQLVDFPFKAKSSAMKILSTVNAYDSIEVIFAAMSLIEFVTQDHKRHWISVFQHHEIDLPEPEEQRAIAEVLSAADREIESLERKLALWKEQKKYLLNNLVTGTIRLPEFVKNSPQKSAKRA